MFLQLDNNDFNTEIYLGGSKSESNRVLMIQAYGGFDNHVENISASDDTQLLKKNLEIISQATPFKTTTINCKNAGTVARFLLTYLSCKPGKWLLTGDDRMNERPVAALVAALRKTGAEIDYRAKEGFLPILIDGKEIVGGSLEIDISQSSQFASSLLLAAPKWKNGLQLTLIGNLNSLPYIDMTISVMKDFVAKIKREGRYILVENSVYKSQDYKVESDWSSASYWYELVALSKKGIILLKDLKLKSLQGDSILAELFLNFGVASEQIDKGVLIRKIGEGKKNFCFDCSQNPDLFPALAATCAGLGIKAVFEGIENLSIKETDRNKAMQNELSKIQIQFKQHLNGVLELYPLEKMPCFSFENPIHFETYNDHRIVMSLAPLSLKIGAIEIRNPEVVSKSYPCYWEEIQKIIL